VHYRAVFEPAFAALAGSLRTVVLSGAKVPPEVFGRLEQLGVWAGQLFGMGEGFFAVTRPGASRLARLTTVGTPMSPLDEYKVLDAGSEAQVDDGQVGELCCAGPYTLRGYFDAAEHNRRAFTSEGFYRTGDLVAVRTIDGERYLSVEGRIKDVINRGGEKINAEEVELLLVQHPDILAAAVIAIPDPRLGERACAYLAARQEPVPLASVQAHLSALGVAKFKWPERLEWVGEMPKTPVGKIDKKALHADITAKLQAEQSGEG
jgi:2,3-dihydroxybenzoate-AMP ligase